MTDSPPLPPSSPRVLVGLLLVAALLGLLAVNAVEDGPPRATPVVAPSPASEAALATEATSPISSPITSEGLAAAPRADLSAEDWSDDWPTDRRQGSDRVEDSPTDRRQGSDRVEEWGEDWDAQPHYLRGERVRGLVVDGQGRPRGEVAVELRADRADEPAWLAAGPGPARGAVVAARGDLLARGRTGPDGAFALVLDQVPAACRSLRLVARDSIDGGLVLDDVPCRAPDEDGAHDLGELRLRASLRLAVRALGAGQPLSGASVTITLRSGPDSSTLVGATDEGGAVAVDLCVPAPDVELVLRSAGRASVRRELPKVDGPRSLEVELPPEVVLQGWVVDAEGYAAAGARVTARPVAADFAECEADADGEARFVIHGLAEGPHAVRALDPRGAWAPVDVEVALPSPALTLRLEAPGALLVTLAPPAEEHVGLAWLLGVKLELLRAGLAPGAWTPAVWHEEARELYDWGDEWGPEWGGPPPSSPPARKLGARERLLVGLAPGRYWVVARDPGSGAASAPVELLITSGAEEAVTLTLVPGAR